MEYAAIADRLAADHPRHVLDWGCGLGHMTRILRDRGLQVTAYDYDEEDAREGLHRRAHDPTVEMYLSSDPIRLPFSDGQFDCALSCGVLEHVLDPDASLEEIKRVLEPGGRLYVYKLANRFAWTQQVCKLAGVYYHGAWPNDRVYTKRTAASLFERHRFRVTELRRANVLPLNLTGRGFDFAAPIVWASNRWLSKLPILNVSCTDLELVATAPE